MSMLKDKAVGEAMVHLEGMFEKVYLVEIDSPRAMSADELKRIADKYFKETEICPDKIRQYKGLSMTQRQAAARRLYAAHSTSPPSLEI